MTEKRFRYDYTGKLFDNKYDTFYPIKDSEKNIELLCKRLNSIVDENNRLKSGDTITDLECEIVLLKDESKYYQIKCRECEEELLYLRRDNKQLKKDVDYWKQVASQYNNELNVNEHLKVENQKLRNAIEKYVSAKNDKFSNDEIGGWND